MKRIKWNWGTKIFLVYAVFVVGMLTLVYMCTQQHFDLVRSDYYEAEIAHQQLMNSHQNTMNLEQQPSIVVNGAAVAISIPEGLQVANGEAYFYRPDNAVFDKKIAFSQNEVTVDPQQLQHGLYTLKLTWESNGKQYYYEDKVFITKPS